MSGGGSKGKYHTDHRWRVEELIKPPVETVTLGAVLIRTGTLGRSMPLEDYLFYFSFGRLYGFYGFVFLI